MSFRDKIKHSGDEGCKTLSVSHCIFSIFDNSRKTKALVFCHFCSKALQYLQSLPMQQASTCGQVLAPGPNSSAQNSGCQMVVSRVETLSE